MKLRTDFVTNSSSSSFIIANKTDNYITSEDVVKALFSKILDDAKDRFSLAPGESINYECGDHEENGKFENFIHNVIHSYMGEIFSNDMVSVEFYRNNH